MSISLAQYLKMEQRVNRGKPDAKVRWSILNSVEKELQLHDSILRECDRRGWLVVHARMDEPTTVARGVPDFIIFADGLVLLIECKTKIGKLTCDQLAWHAWAKKMGQTVHVVRSIDEFLSLL